MSSPVSVEPVSVPVLLLVSAASSTITTSLPAPVCSVSRAAIWSTMPSSLRTVILSSPRPLSIVVWPETVLTANVSLPAAP